MGQNFRALACLAIFLHLHVSNCAKTYLFDTYLNTQHYFSDIFAMARLLWPALLILAECMNKNILLRATKRNVGCCHHPSHHQ